TTPAAGARVSVPVAASKFSVRLDGATFVPVVKFRSTTSARLRLAPTLSLNCAVRLIRRDRSGNPPFTCISKTCGRPAHWTPTANRSEPTTATDCVPATTNTFWRTNVPSALSAKGRASPLPYRTVATQASSAPLGSAKLPLRTYEVPAVAEPRLPKEITGDKS